MADIDGVIVINKPANMTSHDVVMRVRKILGTKRVGHTGTLDPMATGVLVVCIGRATRLVEYLTDASKEYTAGIVFGISTDSHDTTGEVLEEKECSYVNQARLQSVLAQFTGEIEQIPPMVSAIQIGGERLYKKALRGEVVQREARKVHIDRLDIVCFREGKHPSAEIRVACSKGTYVRTLCHDIGQVLGCGAAMSSLVRNRVGPFRLEDSVTLEQLEQAGAAAVKPAFTALPEMPQVRVTESEALYLANGGSIILGECPGTPSQLVRLMTSDTRMIGIGIIMESDTGMQIRPDKIIISRD